MPSTTSPTDTPRDDAALTDPIAVLRAALEEAPPGEAPPEIASLPDEPRWQLGRTGKRRLQRIGAVGGLLLLLLLAVGGLRTLEGGAETEANLPPAAMPVNTPLPTPTLSPIPTEYIEPLLAPPRSTPLPTPTFPPPPPTPGFPTLEAPPP